MGAPKEICEFCGQKHLEHWAIKTGVSAYRACRECVIAWMEFDQANKSIGQSLREFRKMRKEG
jgi:hypothetical protein